MHRDLKPANIMLGGIPTDVYDREVAQRYGTAKIADFGLSKSLALRNAANSHRYRDTGPLKPKPKQCCDHPHSRSWACPSHRLIRRRPPKEGTACGLHPQAFAYRPCTAQSTGNMAHVMILLCPRHHCCVLILCRAPG